MVRKEGQSYTIEDCCADVTYKPKVKNIVHIPSLLGMVERGGGVGGACSFVYLF